MQVNKRDLIHYHCDVEWEEFITEWPASYSHFLVDVQPEYLPAPWEFLTYYDTFEKDLWGSNLSPETVIDQLGVSFNGDYLDHDICIWQGQPFGAKKTQMKLSTRVVVLCMFRSQIMAIVSTIQELMEKFRELINSRERGFFSMMLSSPIVKPPLLLPIQDINTSVIPAIYIWLVTKSPVLEQVQGFEGDVSSSVLHEFSLSGIRYRLVSKPRREAKQIAVPAGIARFWLRMTFVVDSAQDFLSSDYYARDMFSYSMWTYEGHKRQVRMVLSMIEPGVCVVAPGDGIGIVASLWRNSVVGDMYANTCAIPDIPKESFMATMVRGLEQASKSLQSVVLLLSYVYSLFSDEEKEIVRTWPGPVIEIDARSTSSLSHMATVGPGIFCRGFDKLKMIPLPEKSLSVSEQQFSENLLRLPAISCYKDSPTVQYYRTMRPLAPVESYPGSVFPVVTHSLQDAIEVWKIYGFMSLYLGSTGSFTSGPTYVVRGAVNRCAARHVYAISKDDPCVKVLKKSVQWSMWNDWFFYVFLGEMDLRFEISEPRCKMKCRFIVGKNQDMLSVSLVTRVHTPKICIMTPLGLVSWVIRGSVSAKLLTMYLHAFCPDQKLSFESDKSVLLKEWNFFSSFPDERPSFDLGQSKFDRLEEYIDQWQDYLIPDPLCNPLGWKHSRSGSTLEKEFGLMGASSLYAFSDMSVR